MLNKKEKVIFLYLRTGNGHYAIANAVADNLLVNYNIKTKVIDVLSNSDFITRFFLQDFYNKTQLKSKFLFECLYAFNKIKTNSKFSIFAINLILKNEIKDIIQKENPTKIVSAHFFLNQSILDSLEFLKLNIPFISIVTDPFTAPNLWFVSKNINFIVFSDLVKDTAIKKMNINPKNIYSFPMVLDKKYSNKLSLEKIQEIKNKFNIKNKVILILSGGGGMPNGVNIFKNIIKYNKNNQIIVVCGRNEEMFQNIQSIILKEKLENVINFGFVDFVYELISISDLVVTKAGASAIFEILLLGKIPVIASYIWEQEKGNVDFVVDNKFGIYEKKYYKTGSLINHILKNNNTSDFYVNNIKKMNLINGVDLVSDFIVKY